jgi:hypothetical protein
MMEPRKLGVTDGRDNRPLDDRVGEQFTGEPLDVATLEITLDEITDCRRDGKIVRDA